MDKKSNVLMQKYKLGKMLGRGSFAKVYSATDLETNLTVAIKVISIEMVLKQGLRNHINTEITAMRLLKHPNIVEIYEVMASKTKIYIVIEYARGGELFQKIKEGRLKEEEARNYFQQLITAVDFCHSRGVYHRDLKPENLLLDENGVLKVSDFGLSALAESKRADGLLHTRCGTPSYLAPEVINGRAYDGAKADIWSCGVILYVLLTGNLPFHDPSISQLYKKMSRKCFSVQVRKLLKGILNPNPNERFLVSKIMESSWFREGLNSKTITKVEEPGLSDGGFEFDECDNNQETITPTSLTAFDLISRSSGFESDFSSEDLISRLSGFNSSGKVQFTSPQSATSIMSQMKAMTRKLKLKVKKEGASLKLMKSIDSMKSTLSIEAEIFEYSPSFRLVEMKKSNGDTFEFRKMVEEDIRPALKDVVWACQGQNSNNSSICV